MAKLLSDLQNEVRTYLDEAVQTDWKDSSMVIPAINRAYHDVASYVMEVYEQFYETTTPFTYAVQANVQEYAIDSSLIKVTRVEINYNPTVSGSQSSRALAVTMDEIRRNLANTNSTGSSFSSGYYLHGSIGSQYIGFVPIPTTGDTTGKSISVWGIALPTDLVNATDNVNIPYADRFSYLISLRAAAQLLRKGQEEEAAASRYLAEYRQGVQDLMTFLKGRQSDGGKYIEDDLLDDIDFEVLALV
jgi:hypothetical protein